VKFPPTFGQKKEFLILSVGNCYIKKVMREFLRNLCRFVGNGSAGAQPGYPCTRTRGAVAAETLVSLAVLVVLFVIGVSIFLKQSRYDARLFTIKAGQTDASGQANADVPAPVEKNVVAGISAPISTPPVGLDLSSWAPDGFKPAGTQESFGPDALSDKIDGKAELYLECGFTNLTTQRFASTKKPKDWFEISLFDMGNPRNAFAVFGVQRRAGTADASFTEFAYSAGNAVFFLHGRYYVEVISSRDDRGLVPAMTALSKRFMQSSPGGDVKVGEITVLPADGMNKGTFKFFLTNAFSFEKFDHVLTVQYKTGAATTTAFVTVRNSAAEAAALAEGYYNFLMGMGGQQLHLAEGAIPNVRSLDFIGDCEIIFSQGLVVAGIHAGRDRVASAETAQKIYRYLAANQEK